MTESTFLQNNLHVTQWGEHTKNANTVVLVHGGGAGGAASFKQQKPLAHRWRLLLPDLPGHGATPPLGRGDFETDALRIANLLGSGAHLLGHSYGGIVALMAAALRPNAVKSLIAIEPPAFSVTHGRGYADADQLENELRDLFAHPPEPELFLRRFIALNGIPAKLPSPLPPQVLANAKTLRHIRGPWEAHIPSAVLAQAPFRKLIITGGHRQAFEDIADVLATAIGAERVVLPGKGHTVQDVGAPFNEQVERFWLG